MPLETELKTYQTRLPELVRTSLGKYVVIHGADVLGTYGDYEDALVSGYERCRLAPFLVKKIETNETVHSIHRIPSCPT